MSRRAVRRMVLVAGVVLTAIGVMPGVARAVTYPPAATDTIAPTITLTTPRNGATYAKNSVVIAQYTCADTGGSRLGACVGTYPNGSRISTQTSGVKDFKVIASDGAGNITKKTVTYTVAE